jgi:hypothetical protein
MAKAWLKVAASFLPFLPFVLLACIVHRPQAEVPELAIPTRCITRILVHKTDCSPMNSTEYVCQNVVVDAACIDVKNAQPSEKH